MKISAVYPCALAALAIAICGCSHHDNYPDTPSVNIMTPTDRSFTNSWEVNNSPMHTQPGLDGGMPVVLPAIAAVNRYDQNSSLADTVYAALQNSMGEGCRYISVDSKGSVVRLGGTATPSNRSVAVKIAAHQTGVSQVVDHISAQSGT